jgi:muramoyltetrapeptide carboxypeptidase LdcA involved in peptidoglycan recycling
MFPSRYEAGKSYLATAFQLEVVEMPNALRDAQWLYTNPAARADDLMRAYADTSINAIIASIGGDDAIRLIPHVDLAVIRDNPKVFLAILIRLSCISAA